MIRRRGPVRQTSGRGLSYLCCPQLISSAVNDRIGILPQTGREMNIKK